MNKEELSRAFEHITACLGVNRKEIAQMLGVSRQSTYSWQNNTTMTKVADKQVDALVELANMFAKFDKKLPRHPLRMPVFGKRRNETGIMAIRNGEPVREVGKFLLDLFSSDEMQMEVIGEKISGSKRAMPEPLEISAVE